MKAKVAEKAAARRLRAEGMSLREISRELGVALSSVSVWTRDVQPPAPSVPQPSVPIRLEPAQVCPECMRILRASDFHRGQSRCKECRQAYMRRRGDLHRQQSRRARDIRRAAAREYVLEILRAGACADCGLADPAVLEVDPEWRSSRSTRPSRCRNLLFLLDYLRDTPCLDCGERDPVVLDFDHIGVKRSGVVQLAGRECSIANLEAEIAQCEARCANCHRRRTIVEQAHFRNHLVTPP